MNDRAQKYVYGIVCAAAGVAGLYLAGKFLLPWAAPLITALLLAAFLERAVRRMCAHGWSRHAAAGCLTLALTAGLIALAVFTVSRGMNFLMTFTGELKGLVAAAAEGLERLEGFFAGMTGSPARRDGAALASVTELGEKLSSGLLSLAGRIAQSGPDVLLFAVTAGIGTYFLSSEYPKVTAFLRLQLPDGLRRRFEGMGGELRASLGGWLRAQLIMMGLTFAELTAALSLLHVRGALTVSVVTALIDALPVFGTGAVLLPWAAYCFVAGDPGRGAGLAVTWAIVSLLRSCMQAKLLGDQIGLDPAVSLFAMYVGYKVWSVAGMLTFPILAVLLCRLNERGVVRLWRLQK